MTYSTITIEEDPETIYLEKEKDPYVIIIPIVLSVVVVVLIAIGCRYYMSKSKRDLVEAQNRAQRVKDFKIRPTTGGFEDVLGEKELAELRNLKNINFGDD